MSSKMLSLVIFMVCVSDAFCLVTFDTQTLSKISNHDAEIKELQRVVQVLKSAFIMMGNSYTNMTLQYEQLMDNNRMLEAKLQTISQDCSSLCSSHLTTHRITGPTTLHTTVDQAHTTELPAIVHHTTGTRTSDTTKDATKVTIPSSKSSSTSPSSSTNTRLFTEVPCVDSTPEATCRLASGIVCVDYTLAMNSNCLHYCGYC